MTGPDPSSAALIADTENWVAHSVVRHRFCPFAKPVLDANLVSYTVIDAANTESALNQFAERVSRLINDAAPRATELLIFGAVGVSFDDFLDLTALADALLESMGWHERVQLATFHPDYCFADTDPESIENYTNRAPWPVIQLLQVDAVADAIEQVGSTDDIPVRNIETLHALSADAAAELEQLSCASSRSPDVPRD